ncbi:thiosulfate oxidation carrier complex protein SoxZ [Pseudomonadota bacterium]
MASKPKLRAKFKDGETSVKAVLIHPMESGRRKDKATGQLIPAEFIQEINCMHQGKTVLSVTAGSGLSADPYLHFIFAGGAKGDTIKLHWVDNQGKSGSIEAPIK